MCSFVFVIDKQSTKIAEMHDKTFVSWWKDLTPAEKDSVAIALANDCNTALFTVQAWGLGYRNPKKRSQEIIVKYLAGKGIITDCKTLFP